LAQLAIYHSYQPSWDRHVRFFLSLSISAHQRSKKRLPPPEKIPTTSIPQLLDHRRHDRPGQLCCQSDTKCPTLRLKLAPAATTLGSGFLTNKKNPYTGVVLVINYFFKSVINTLNFN